MAFADGLYHHATTKRDLHLSKEVLSLIFLQNLINSLVITIIHTETLKAQGNPIPCLKTNASQKLSVSFLHNLNKHNVCSVIKLSTIRKSMLLMQMSMLVLMLLPGYHSFQLYIFNDLGQLFRNSALLK